VEKMLLELEGLSCNHCVMRVRRALEKAEAKVESIDLRSAVVLGKKDDLEKFLKAVEDAGYRAKLREV